MGVVYAANTLGAILGALVFSLILVGTIGTQQSQRVLMVLVAIAGVIMLVPARGAAAETPAWGARGIAAGVGTVVLTALLATTIVPVPALLVGYGRFTATWMTSRGDFIFVGEGTNSSMAVSRLPRGYLNYHNAGKVQASSGSFARSTRRVAASSRTSTGFHSSASSRSGPISPRRSD